MPFDWQEFLNLAESLLAVDTEAAYRSAISRAYYSVFNVALERAHENKCRFDSELETGIHKKCWALYSKGPDLTCVQLGIDGDRLRESRVRADYKSGEYRRLSEDARQVIAKARLLRTRLATLDRRYPLP